MRIVSLLPAATDVVVTLGLGGSLVGRTHECDWPPNQLAAVEVVTRTSLAGDGLSSREINAAVAADRAHAGSSLYALATDRLAALEPDLVLTQELCDVCAVSYSRVAAAVRVAEPGPRLVSLEPRTLTEVLGTLTTLGGLTGAEAAARAAVTDARQRLAAVAAAVAGRQRPRVAVVEWLDPFWPAGHWVPEQVAAAGGVEVLGEAGAHTSPVPWQRVLDLAPEVLVLAPCGFPPARTLRELPALTARPGWDRLPAVRAGQVWVVDGPAYLNRPGPRVVRGVEVLAHLVHGVGELFPGEAVRLDPGGPADPADPPPLRDRLAGPGAAGWVRAAAESGWLAERLPVAWTPTLAGVLARLEVAGAAAPWPLPLAALLHAEPPGRVPELLAAAGLAAELPAVRAVLAPAPPTDPATRRLWRRLQAAVEPDRVGAPR